MDWDGFGVDILGFHGSQLDSYRFSMDSMDLGWIFKGLHRIGMDLGWISMDLGLDFSDFMDLGWIPLDLGWIWNGFHGSR